jgi:hypothetical protein
MLKRSISKTSAIRRPSIHSIFSSIRSQQTNFTKTTRMAASRSAEDFIDMAEGLDLTNQGAKRNGRGLRSNAGARGGSDGRVNRAGGSGGGVMNREVAISKALSKLLRHAAVDAGLKLDPEGFCRVDQAVCFLSPCRFFEVASPPASSEFILCAGHVYFLNKVPIN